MPLNPYCYVIALLKLSAAGIPTIVGLLIDISSISSNMVGIGTLMGAILTGILFVPMIEWAKKGIKEDLDLNSTPV